MIWPPRVQEIVNLLAVGPDAAHSAEDEKRRAITRKIAEQCRLELGPNWGTKRADPGRPPSADVVSTQSPFIGWDWSVPGGVAQFPESIDLAGQTFVAVEPINHLAPAPVPAPEPIPVPPPTSPLPPAPLPPPPASQPVPAPLPVPIPQPSQRRWWHSVVETATQTFAQWFLSRRR
mgnify:CR=1 FL=1